MRPARVARRLAVALLATGLTVLAACGTSGPPSGSGPAAAPSSATATPTAGATPVDAQFVLHMLPHHERALQVGALMAAQGSDPRVREVGQRIVAEQTPERDRLQSWVSALHLTPSPGDAAMASGYIDDATLARLRGESGAVLDRDALLSSANSETGAAEMSATELQGGTYAPARDLATAISTAPAGEIPQLRSLAAQLG
jgi:uncharacterized protein (DUF305 family)